MDIKHCFSCGMPLDVTQSSGNYCNYCTNMNGQLKSKTEVQQVIADWMKMWQPGLDDAKALKRASSYMSGMPSWAES
jgi:thioredoxin-related protein